MTSFIARKRELRQQAAKDRQELMAIVNDAESRMKAILAFPKLEIPEPPKKSKPPKVVTHTYIEGPEYIFWASCCKGNPPAWPKYCKVCGQYRPVQKRERVFTPILKPRDFDDGNKPKDPTCAYCGHKAGEHARGGCECYHVTEYELDGKPMEDHCTCTSFVYGFVPLKKDIHDSIVKWMESARVEVAAEPIPYNPWYKGTRLSWSHWVIIIAGAEGEVMQEFYLSSVYHRPPSAALVVLSLYKAANRIRSKYVVPFDLHRRGSDFEELVSTVLTRLEQVLGPAYDTLGEIVRR